MQQEYFIRARRFLIALFAFLLASGLLVPGLRSFGQEEAADGEEAAEEAEPVDEEEKLDATLEIELKYADALTQMGLPDYAKIVLGRLNAEEIGPRMEVIKIQGLIAMGKFPEVTKVIASKPDQGGKAVWAMKLALADGYYAWGKYKEAQALYNAFFKAYPDAPPKALNNFYRDSAYKYAQMLLLMGETKQALKAYQQALKAKLKKHVKRQLTTETAELMVRVAEKMAPADRKKAFEEVTKLLDQILYGANDLWFGKAMAMMAHMKVMEGDNDGAMFLVESSMEQLVGLDGALRYEQEKEGVDYLRFSPMAQCRYLLGDMMLKEAKKLFPIQSAEDKRKAFKFLAGRTDEKGKKQSGAYQHFMNVFYQYPSSQWAPSASEKAKESRALLLELGAKIKETITPEILAKVEREQFKEARNLFRQQQFKQAAEAYVRVLNLYPETETAVSALAELAKCYVEMSHVAEITDDDKETYQLYLDVIVRYLSERFNKNEQYGTKAGDQVLRIAGKFEEFGIRSQRDRVYDTFFEFFTEHPRTPSKLFEVGLEKFKAEDWDSALTYFSQISTNYSGDRVYFPSLSKMSQCYNKKSDTLEEAKVLTKLTTELKKESAPGHLLISSSYRLAYAYKTIGQEHRRSGDEEKMDLGEKYIRTAIAKYIDITKMLSEKGDPYQKTPEEAENNKKILEGSYFYTAFCYSLLTKPEDKVKDFKQLSIRTYTTLVEKFPESPFGPGALSQIGTLWTVLEDADQARKALDQLQKKYPNSDEAKNALFMLGMNLLELGKRPEAIKVFEEMFKGAGQYTTAQILTSGLELLKAGQYEIALQALEKVMAASDKGKYEEIALLGLGKAQCETGKFAESVKSLEALVEKYSKSRSIVEGYRYLSRSYAELVMREPDADKRFAMFNNAILALKRVKRYDKTPEDAARTNLDIALVYIKRVEAEKKFGTPESAKVAVNKAILPLLSMTMTANPDDIKVLPFIGTAYHKMIPLYLEDERWKDAYIKSAEYIKLFPRGPYRNDVRKWRAQAETKLVMLGISKEETEVDEGVPTAEEMKEDDELAARGGEPSGKKEALPEEDKTLTEENNAVPEEVVPEEGNAAPEKVVPEEKKEVAPAEKKETAAAPTGGEKEE